MSQVVVRALQQGDHFQWQEFVGRHDQSTFFHRIEWMTLLSEQLGYRCEYLVAECGSELVGILPLVHVKSFLFGSSLVSLPFCSYAGPLGTSALVVAELVKASCQRASELGVQHLETRSMQPISPGAPAIQLYYTFRAEIPAGLDDMSGIPQKRRNVIRRAVALGLSSDVSRDADRFYDLYAENARSHGTPALGKDFFVALVKAFPDDLDILFVKDADGVDVSAILNFYHRKEVLAYFAGEIVAARKLNANDFKYWALMRHAHERGCKLFDFGRSKAGTGSFKFKKLWGFSADALSYEFPYLPGATVPENNPLNPKFRLAIETWKRLPRFVVDRVGPKLVRGLG